MKEFISTEELKKLGFTSKNWNDEGIDFTDFKLRKGEIAIVVNFSYDSGVLFEQYTELMIGREWEKLDHINTKESFLILVKAVFNI